VAISASHSPGLSIAGEIIMAVGMGVSNAAVFKLVPQYVPNAIGGASGWVGGLGALGGFVFPPLLGAMVIWMGQPGYGDGFVVFCAFFLVSLALSAWLKRAGRRTG
jgi:NNP family nitrate/nitrite transporter-like MFS transporter